MTTQNKLYAVLLLTLAAMMTACSSKSDSGGTDSSSLSTSAKITYAACNQATSTSGNMKLNIEALYQDSVIRSDLMRAQFTGITSNFANGTNYIQMWRWQANSAGQAYVDSTPVQFSLELISTGQVLASNLTSMKWSDISSIASSVGASTPAQFFALVRMTVDTRDTLGAYQVLKVTYYDTTTNAAVDQLDVLLPLFAVNPTDYAIQPDGSARPTILRNLHPFKSMTGTLTSQMVAIINSYCF